MTTWLARRSSRADPRSAVASTIVAFVSTSALAFVLGLASSSEIMTWLDLDSPDADISPVVVATALVTTAVLIRVHALAVRGDEVETALLAAAGARPVELIRLSLVRAGGSAVLGAVLAAPFAHVLVLTLARPSLEASFPCPSC